MSREEFIRLYTDGGYDMIMTFYEYEDRYGHCVEQDQTSDTED